MQTPRLCIDVRAAAECAFQGLIAQEVVDQLVAAIGEPGTGSPWLERHRTVLVSHPGQVFSGQLRRFDTSRRIGRSLFYRLWEKNLIRHAHVTAYHRFRPIDRALPFHRDCQTLTTLLPPKRGLPIRLTAKGADLLVVPSERDKALLEIRYGIDGQRIEVVRPGTRRYVHHSEGPNRPSDTGFCLMVTRTAGERNQAKKLQRLLRQIYPTLPQKLLNLDDGADLSPQAWVRQLSQTRVLVYLPEVPFDSGTLALEAIYWKTPTLFSERNAALSELLPGAAIGMARFLVDQPKLESLGAATLEAREKLDTAGIFEPLAAARQYRSIYERLN